MSRLLEVVQGDVLATLRDLDDDCVDAILSDFPYGLSREPNAAEMLRHWIAPELREYAEAFVGAEVALAMFPADAYEHGGRGFMGKRWDSFVPGPEVARELLRVLKPGGHALIFGGTRTYDLTVLALRLGGFEVRDQLAWMYGSGFPKSKSVAAAIDKSEGVIGHRSIAAVTAGVADCSGGRGPDRSVGAYVPEDGTPGSAHAGEGTALKPAQEPIVLVRKALDGTVAANVLKWGTGGLQIDACRINLAGGDQKSEGGRTQKGSPNESPIYSSGKTGGTNADGLGRWPANVILDPEAAAILDEQAGATGRTGAQVSHNRNADQSIALGKIGPATTRGHADSGGASRFFYQAKAATKERERFLAEVGAPAHTGGGGAPQRSPDGQADRAAALPRAPHQQAR